MKYSCFTVGMPDIPPKQAVVLLAKLGYDGLEWRTTPQQDADPPGFWAGNLCTLNPETVPAEAKQIRRMTRAAGLKMFALGTYSNAGGLKAVERDMIAAVALGVKQLRVGPVPYDKSKDYARQFTAAQRQHVKVVKLAAKYKLRANVEIHPGSLVISASSAIRLLGDFDPKHVGVIWDPGNTVTEGYEPAKIAVEVLGKHLAYVHAKNARGAFEDVTAAGTAVWRTAWAPMRVGIINWEDILAALIRHGYDGWLSFEDFGPGKTADKLRENIKYLRTCEKAARGAVAKEK